MTLRSTTYVCNTCGKTQEQRTSIAQKPRRRWVLHCSSRKCKGKRRVHYPQRRPLTGDYR